MRKHLDAAVSIVLVAAAVMIAAAATRTAFFPSGSGSTPGGSEEPRFYEGWEEWLSSGRRLSGDGTAPVRIIEFGDLECPYCARFHEDVLRPFVEERGDVVEVTFIHLPLRIHRFARPAAVAAECAANQNRFASFAELALEKRDSLGLKTWVSYALEAGVSDSTRFSECVTDPRRAGTRVDRGSALADSLGVTATPTIVVNGWRLPVPPSLPELNSMVDRILAGADPVQTPGDQE